jgi:hypothetical protein
MNPLFNSFPETPQGDSEQPNTTLYKPSLGLIKIFFKVILIIIITVIFLFSNNVKAQNSAPEKWKFIQKVEGVTFYYKVSDCNATPYLMLKVVNENSTSINGTWNIVVDDLNNKRHFSGTLIPVKPGESKESSCTSLIPDFTFPIQRPLTPTELNVTVNAKIRKL